MSGLSNTILFALGCGVLGVIYAALTAIWVSKQDAGNAKMQEISNAVKEGAMAFLAREYKTVAVVAVINDAAMPVGLKQLLPVILTQYLFSSPQAMMVDQSNGAASA